MKKQLDDQVAKKSGALWMHTVKIVHRSDPNAHLIAKLSDGAMNPSHPSALKKKSALHRVKTRSDSMQSKLKAELDADQQIDWDMVKVDFTEVARNDSFVVYHRSGHRVQCQLLDGEPFPQLVDTAG